MEQFTKVFSSPLKSYVIIFIYSNENHFGFRSCQNLHYIHHGAFFREKNVNKSRHLICHVVSYNLLLMHFWYVCCVPMSGKIVYSTLLFLHWFLDAAVTIGWLVLFLIRVRIGFLC